MNKDTDITGLVYVIFLALLGVIIWLVPQVARLAEQVIRLVLR
jgi:hypothetical protein